MLYHLGQSELSNLLLPLGEHAKSSVREMSPTAIW